MSALVGRRVVVTRADEQADATSDLLIASGAVPIRCPTIRIAAPASYAVLDTALARLDTYDWVVFTSANGVRTVLARTEELGAGVAGWAARDVAAVGRVTATALEERGVSVAYVPSVEGSRGLAESLPDVAGRSVLLAIGDKADPLLGRVLRERGARQVDIVTAYVTVPVAPDGAALRELRKGVDAITFTSPSTVAGFVAVGPEWPGLVRGAVVATIGPTTTTAARRAGLGVDAEARERSAFALIEAVADALTTGSKARTGGVR